MKVWLMRVKSAVDCMLVILLDDRDSLPVESSVAVIFVLLAMANKADDEHQRLRLYIY